jgi:hypothetical protein
VLWGMAGWTVAPLPPAVRRRSPPLAGTRRLRTPLRRRSPLAAGSERGSDRGSQRLSKGSPKAPEGSQRLPEAPRGSRRLPEVPRGSQKLHMIPKGSEKLTERLPEAPPEVPKGSSQRLPKATRDSQRSKLLEAPETFVLGRLEWIMNEPGF